jgi:hypothetical protein
MWRVKDCGIWTGDFISPWSDLSICCMVAPASLAGFGCSSLEEGGDMTRESSEVRSRKLGLRKQGPSL